MSSFPWTRASRPGLVLTALLASCGGEKEPDDGITLLEPREQLIRLSVDLRGVQPSEQELVAIEANPDLYEQFVDRYLEDERFLDRIEEVFNYRYLTRTGELPVDRVEDAILRGLDEDVVADSLNDEPLKLIRHIVANDRPFTDVVMAEYTMADPITAWMWATDYADGADGWQQATYTDGRPQRGVLSMTTMWTRYPSAGVNNNRHRANAVSRILLCDDYLARPVSFARTEVDALTGGSPEDVIRETPTCQSCHNSLDPLASHFYGFWWEVDGDFREQTTYRPEDEELWRQLEDTHGRAPGYFGRPTTGIYELADEIAKDERFVDCAVETVFVGLTQRDVSDQDWTELRAHREDFVASGLVVRDLVKSVVMSRPYRAASGDESAPEGLVTVKMASPSQLESIIEAETGYRWTLDGRDGLSRNAGGLAVLAGGIDSQYVTVPSHDPSVGVVFIQERLAQAAAWHVASHDLDPDRTEDAILLEYVTVEDVPETSREAFEGQIRALYRELTGIPLEETEEEPAPEIEALITLWKELYSVNASPTQAWAGVVSVVLRDPRILFY